MNKIYLLILITNSILISMDKPFSTKALDNLALTQEVLAAQTPVIPSLDSRPPQIQRTKLSSCESFPTRPDYPNKLNFAHRDSAPDIDDQRVTQVRTFAHLRGKDGSIQ